MGSYRVVERKGGAMNRRRTAAAAVFVALAVLTAGLVGVSPVAAAPITSYADMIVEDEPLA